MVQPTTLKTSFNALKALAAILYVACRHKDVSFHTLSKVLYFADRESLHQYGRTICGDSYIAMKHGPVPSGVYDMLKAVRGDDQPWHSEYKRFCQAFEVNGRYSIVAKAEPDLRYLSKSDRECLDQAIEQYGQMSFGRLTQASHDKAWKAADENDAITLETIVQTLPDGEALMEHLKNPHPGHADV